MNHTSLSSTTASYIALVASLVAVSTTSFLALTIDRIVDSSVQDAVIVTKVQIAELQAAADIASARSSFSKTKAYIKLETDLAEIGSGLSSIYASAPASEQDDWQQVKYGIDESIRKAKEKDQTVVADLDALVILLRSQ